MEYQETYHGHRLIVTTSQQADGQWAATARLLSDDGEKLLLDDGQAVTARSEEEARRQALSRAAGSIDRARMAKGKP